MKIFYTLIFLFFISSAYSQEQPVEKTIKINSDSLAKQQPDTSNKIKMYDPKVAARRSAIIPGWGQIYNKKYWKVPIVYTAIGIPAYLFVDNQRWYKRTKYAYAVSLYPNPRADSLAAVHPRLKYFVQQRASESLVNYRNEFRRNMDYSILFFLLFWSLNIVDATVDAHLRDFDVSPDLSLKLKPVLNNNNYGVGLVLTFK